MNFFRHFKYKILLFLIHLSPPTFSKKSNNTRKGCKENKLFNFPTFFHCITFSVITTVSNPSTQPSRGILNKFSILLPSSEIKSKKIVVDFQALQQQINAKSENELKSCQGVMFCHKIL